MNSAKTNKKKLSEYQVEDIKELFIEVFRKNYDSAINYFTQAIIADNSYVEAYFGRAYCYELIGDLVKSESDYRTSLMLDAKYMPSRKGMDRIKELQ